MSKVIKYRRVDSQHLRADFRQEIEKEHRFLTGTFEPELGADARCYYVSVLNHEDNTWHHVGYVVSNKKYGKVAWEVWASNYLLASGLSTRAGAACLLREVAQAMGVMDS